MTSNDEQRPRSGYSITRLHEVCVECRAYDRILPAAFLGGVIVALLYVLLFAAPKNFPAPLIIKVQDGQTLADIAQEMQDRHLVRYGSLLKLVMRALGGNKKVQAGSYYFPAPQDLYTVAQRLESADFELNPVRVYVSEGMSVKDIGALLGQKLAPFDEDGFVAAASSSEGYLYPDTYFFFPGQDPDVVLRAMRSDFVKNVAEVQSQIDQFGKPTKDVVTMASILVGEARTDKDRRIVAGILWKRIQMGIPLQVDAPFAYVYDKPLTQLKSEDLKVDSPYNTYLNKGLPPTPINNPGVEAVREAATPIKTNYLYYISDQNGVMHYSATFAQHEQQIQEYLR